MTRRLLLALALVCVAARPAAAQRTTYEQLTVSTSAVNIAAATLVGRATCTAVLETAAIRYRTDGTNPTASVGLPLLVGSVLHFSSIEEARSARFIRSGGTDGVLNVECYAVAANVAQAGSGGASADITGDALTALQSIASDIETIATNPGTEVSHGNTVVGPGTPINVEGSAAVISDTPITDGQVTRPKADLYGRLWLRDGGPCADWDRVTHAVISETTGATNEIVALTASQVIIVCSYKWVVGGATSLSWTRGTGTDCGTGTTAVEGAQPYAANGGVAESNGGAPLFVVPAGNALCLVSSAAVTQGGRVSYVKALVP